MSFRLLIAMWLFSLPASLFSAGLEPGSIAPPFTLNDLADNPLTLADSLNAGPTALAFFRSDCSHCKVEMPLLQKLSVLPEYSKIKFLAVNVREKAPAITEFVEKHGISFPVLLDPKMAVTRAYKVASIPQLFFLKQDGSIAAQVGSAGEEQIRENLDALLGNGQSSGQKVLLIVPSLELESGFLLLEAAKEAGYDARVWEMAKDGLIPEEELVRYVHAPVVRCVNAEFQISRDEETAYLGFLSDGGKLLFTGNDLTTLCSEKELFKYYLLAEHVSDDAGTTNIQVDASDPDFGHIQLSLREKTPDYGLVRPDVMKSLGEDCVPLIFYDGQSSEVAALFVKT